MNNIHISDSNVLITTSESRRSGFLQYALRRNKESVPFMDKSKALKATLQSHTKSAIDILSINSIRQCLLEAAGISVKASAHLSPEDKERLLDEFVNKILIPCGNKYIDEVIFRYLLTSGDALGGKMRNIVGSIANEKFTRFVVSQLQISSIPFEFATKNGVFIASSAYTADKAELIKVIKWKNHSGRRMLIYNISVPVVNKNIDIVLLSKHSNSIKSKEIKSLLLNNQNYLAIGELKGGIDPAGADEHWKTANTALMRVREKFGKELPLFFVGAAIESAMAREIYDQYISGYLGNCANLTSDDQLASLCDWLVKL